MVRFARTIRRICFLATAGGFLVGCSHWIDEPVKSEPVAARVYERNLLLSEIEDHIPNGTSPEDSVAMASRYMDQWIREQVMVHQAELRLPDGDADFSRDKKLCFLWALCCVADMLRTFRLDMWFGV